MKAYMELLLGLLLILGVGLIVVTWPRWLLATIRLVQGGLMLGLALVGLGLIFLGVNELRE